MDLSHYKEPKPHRTKQIFWRIINATIFRCLIGRNLKYARNFLLKCFGAKLPYHVSIAPSTTIWAPWLLEMGDYSCVGPHVQVYNKDKIIIGNHSVVSQGTFLCTASHDITENTHPLITAPITIHNHAWVAADAFIGPGVTVGEGAVVGARAVVTKDVDSWIVVGGNPAMFIKKREMK